MFWKKSEPVDMWYEMALQMAAVKIVRDLKPNKTYHDIPFGYSLLDIYTNSHKFDMTINTVVGDETVVKTHWGQHISDLYDTLNVGDFLKLWENVDKKQRVNLYLMDKIVPAVSRLVFYSPVEQDSWVFPFYNTMITLDMKSPKIREGSKVLEGVLSVRAFDDECGYSGPVWGTLIEPGEEKTPIRYFGDFEGSVANNLQSYLSWR